MILHLIYNIFIQNLPTKWCNIWCKKIIGLLGFYFNYYYFWFISKVLSKSDILINLVMCPQTLSENFKKDICITRLHKMTHSCCWVKPLVKPRHRRSLPTQVCIDFHRTLCTLSFESGKSTLQGIRRTHPKIMILNNIAKT